MSVILLINRLYVGVWFEIWNQTWDLSAQAGTLTLQLWPPFSNPTMCVWVCVHARVCECMCGCNARNSRTVCPTNFNGVPCPVSSRSDPQFSRTITKGSGQASPVGLISLNPLTSAISTLRTSQLIT